MFNLGPNSQLVLNNFTRVIEPLKARHIKTYAMISSYPYPKEFIEWMRQLFANPQPFMSSAVSQALQLGFDGYNIDFEPTVGIEKEDAVAYVQFLNKFADVLHANGIEVSVDVATWSVLWDWPALNLSNVDKIMVMSTYAGDPDTWKKYFDLALAEISPNKLGLGLQTVNPNTNQPLSRQELEYRFSNILPSTVVEIDIWDSPLENNWWEFLARFVNNPQ